MNSTPTPLTVKEQLLHHAQTLLMTRGYNGFSYRDLSGLVGVKTSSIHYYFPTKEDLVREAVDIYNESVIGSIHRIDETLSADKKLSAYADAVGAVAADGSVICLCGMLAADIASLPDPIREAVQLFFQMNESWLAQVLQQGKKDGTLTVNGEVRAAARALFAAFQGSLLTSRLFQAPARVRDVASTVMKLHTSS